MPEAEGDVHDGDAKRRAIVDHPLQGFFDAGIGHGIVRRVIDSQCDEFRIGCNAGILETVEDKRIGRDHAGDACAVAGGVHGIGVIVEKIITADHLEPRPKSAAQRWIGVVDASVDHGNGLAGAVDVRMIGGGDILANEHRIRLHGLAAERKCARFEDLKMQAHRQSTIVVFHYSNERTRSDMIVFTRIRVRGGL